MLKYVIKGPSNKAKGIVNISGAKNSVLLLMAASILFDDHIILKNVPLTNDVYTMEKLLCSLGSQIQIDKKNKTIKIHNKKKLKTTVPRNVVKQMRASLATMGPLLGKYGSVQSSFPGGCSLGFRGINFSLNGFNKLGASHKISEGYIKIKSKKIHGGYYKFPKISVTGTANLIMASVLAKSSRIIIKNVSREPEVLDLILMLRKAGSIINFKGTRTLEIKGVDKLTGITHKVISDRVEAFSYLCVGAITKGNVKVKNINPNFLREELNVLRKIGCKLKTTENSIEIKVNKKLKSTKIKTAPAPGFATDNQPMLMALLTLAHGKSEITETIFSNRFAAAAELNRMNASIVIKKNRAIIIGVDRLEPADCMVSDLRCGFALILGAIAARDKKNPIFVERVYHIERGYFNIIKKLQGLKIDIKATS